MTSTFKDWVNQNFSNQKLKTVILNKKDFIISNKEKIIKKRLNNNFRIIKKKANVHDKYQFTNITAYKAKKIMKKKNS